ncbi:MAG: GTPase [Planctomycetia bacterium]
MHDTPVRVALLTPPGRGALAVVGVAGAAALHTVAKLFHPRGGAPLASRPDGTIAFGRWADPERGEELVVVRRSPASLEVHCHGGVAASAAVIGSLEAAGAVRQPWPEWLASGGDSEIEIEVEAREALAQANGPKAVRILARQLAGELGCELDRIESLRAAGRQAEADAAAARLMRAARVGLRLTKPWRVVVAGPVNAGKSSLVNALAGHARSIVSAEPGTTRDLLETRIVLDGWEIDLIDTAGLRGEDLAAASPTERAGIERAVAATAEADLVLRLSRVGFSLPHPREINVLSQCDLLLPDAPPHPSAIRTSTVTGEGIAELAAAIVRRLVPEEHDDPTLLAGPMPFTQRQLQTIVRQASVPVRRRPSLS